MTRMDLAGYEIIFWIEEMGKLSASVIVPLHNAEKFICQTLDSILSQSEERIEIIVVDDHSIDRSAELVREVQDNRIRLIGCPSHGIANAMNAGLAEARSEIIMCCDADDIYPPARIAAQLAWLGSHPEYAGICGQFSAINNSGKLIATMGCGDIARDITEELNKGSVRTSFCTYAMRTAVARQVGGFREFFKSAQDIDFQLRVSEAGKVYYVPEIWYFYRIHSGSITHTQPNATREFYEHTAYVLHKQRQTLGVDDLQSGRPPKVPNDMGLPPHRAKGHIQGLLLGRAWQEHRAGRKLQALHTGVRALAMDPLHFAVWRSVFAILLKPTYP